MGSLQNKKTMARGIVVLVLLVALVVGVSGQAMAADFTLTQNSTWDTATGDDTSAAANGDNVNIVTFDLTHSNLSAIKQLGAVTGTTGDLLVTAATTTSNAVTAGSITLTGAGSNITLTNTDGGSGGAVSVTTSGATSIQGNLSVVNSMTTAGGAMFYTGTGAMSINGTTTITATTQAGSTSTVTASNTATFTGAVTITGSTGNAVLNLNGATATATGGISLAGTAANAIVNFTPTAAQTFTGTIDSSDATDRGTVNVLGSANVTTFASAIGATNNILALNVGNGTTDGRAVFSGNVSAATITVDGEAGVGSTADFNGNVVGALNVNTGGTAGDTATVTIAGNLTGVTTLDNQAGGDAATVTFDGTSAQTVVGNVVTQADGDGLLIVSNTAGVTFNDDIGVAGTGLGSIRIASGATLTQKTLGAGDALTFDVVGNVDANGAAGTGGTLALETLAGAGTTAGDAITLATITGNTTLTTVNITTGAGATGTGGATGGAGGAFTQGIFTGTTAANINITAGNGAAGGSNTNAADVGGAGGAIGGTSLTYTGAITGNVAIVSGSGGAGGAGGGTAAGAAGGAGGAVTLTDATAGITGNLTLTAGNGGAGGSGATANAGANGAAGGLITVTAVAGVSGTTTVTTGTGGNGGAVGAANGGNGAAGGAVTITDIDGAAGAITVTAGNGGNGADGGAVGTAGTGAAGGLFTLTDVTGATVTGNVTMTSGTGGNGGTSGVTAGGAAGNGGGVTVSDITAAITGNLNLTGGAGGNGGIGTGGANAANGGNGGAVAATISAALTGNATLTAGAGGNGGAAGAGAGNGGNGGTGASVTATFENNITGTLTLDDGAAGTAGAAGTGTVGAAGAAGTVTVNFTGAAARTIGNVRAGADNEGALVVNNSAATAADVTFSSIGTSSAALKSLTITDGDVAVTGDTFVKSITGAAGDLFDFNGNVTAATTLTLVNGSNANFAGNVTASTQFTVTTGATTLTFDGTGAQSITGALTNDVANRANVTNSNTGGIVTFNSAVGVTGTKIGTITGATGSKTVFKGGVHAQAITLAGTGQITLETVSNTLTGALTTAVGNTITLGTNFINGTTAITSTGSEATLNQTANAVTLNLSSNFTSGTVTLIDDTNALDATDAASFNVTDTALVDYTVAATGNNVVVTAVKKSTSAAAATLGVTNNAASALDGATTALSGASSAQDTATQAALTTALNAGGSVAKEAAEQVQGSPAALSAAGSAAVTATGSQVIAVGSSRLASLRSGPQFASSQASGFAGGADAMNYGIWMKPFVNFGDQDQRKGIAGYETDTYGLAIGGDVKVGDAKRTTLGMSFSYANTDVDSKGSDRARTDIDSYQGTLYADYTTNKWYVEGLIGFARNQIDTSRKITAGNLTPTADYGSNQFMFNIGGGMPMEIATNHFITPNASFQYTLVENETYTETGAGALNLRVDQDEVHIAMGIFGARYHTHTEMKSGTLTPEIRTALTYDFAGDEGQSTSVFNGGGAAFSVQGADVVQLGYTAGLGLSYAPTGNQGLTLSANYDWNQKTDFVGHSANFALRYEF